MINKLQKICETKENVNLKTLCTMRIGGIGRVVCYPKNVKELKRLIRYLNKTHQKYFVVGNGSNIVFEDGGVDEVLIILRKMCGFKIKNNKIKADCGLNLFTLNYICAENSLTGLEWSYGIPASVGGAICMNAGAYGGEIKDFVEYVYILQNGKIKKIKNDNMGFGYRTSRVLGTNDIVVSATFVLQDGDSDEILAKQKQIFAYRKCCQPYGTYNCGSVFKKSNGESAGKTIDKLGLKSVKIGNIQINSLHANFFVNLGDGTCSDLHKLINFTKAIVKEKTGLDLEEEVIFVGNKKDEL